jgi:aminoglycoside 6'-N-acetyltransferase I
MNLTICRAEKEDALTVAKLAIQMWEDNVLEELAEEFAELTGSSETAVFLGTVDGQAIGFAQCQLRHDYVEGTETSPVGYLEGIFVAEQYRRMGTSRMLLTACEQWAKTKGCTEFASDCELDNTQSLRFHLNVGFTEANRIICFTKKLCDKIE